MKWTKEKPTVPGWYWCKSDFSDAYPIKVENKYGELFANGTRLKGLDYFWAGPIPEPEEG